MTTEKKNRRFFIGTATAAIGGLVVGAVAGWLAKPPERIELPGVTVTETKTETRTITVEKSPTTVVETLTSPPPVGLTEYKIGMITPLSGVLAEFGAEQRDAGLLAVDEMNELLEQVGAPHRFRVIVIDDKATPEEALKAISTLRETHGIQVIIGPPTSGSVLAIKSYVDTYGIAVISSTSSSAALSVKDNIFRMWASDRLQGKAMADLAKYLGIQNAVIVYRDDPYGRGVHDIFAENFDGNKVDIRITPGLPDYASEVATMSRAAESFGLNEKTGIIAIIWESEWVNFLSHVVSEYPQLQKVKWIGSDAITNPGILPPKSSEEFAEFLISVKAVGTTAHFTENPLGTKVLQHLKEKRGGTPSIESLYMYDAAYVAMLSILVAGKYDGKTIVSVIPSVAAHYNGASGPKILDDVGDLATQDYDIVSLVKLPEGYKWESIGVWSPATGITMK